MDPATRKLIEDLQTQLSFVSGVAMQALFEKERKEDGDRLWEQWHALLDRSSALLHGES